jgi:single-strand DNA-binding protein
MISALLFIRSTGEWCAMSNFGEVQVTVAGTVASEPELFVCANGSPRAAFRLVSSEGRYDRQLSRWVTTKNNFYSVVCWRGLADHVGSALGKGDPVLVIGRQRVLDGSGAAGRGAIVEISAFSVGHDLRFGLSQFQRVRRGAANAAGGEPDPFAAELFPGLAEALASEQSAGSTKI